MEDDLEALAASSKLSVHAIDPQNNDSYILHTACQYGRVDIGLKYIIEQDVDVNIRDKWLKTPLHYAGICALQLVDRPLFA